MATPQRNTQHVTLERSVSFRVGLSLFTHTHCGPNRFLELVGSQTLDAAKLENPPLPFLRLWAKGCGNITYPPSVGMLENSNTVGWLGLEATVVVSRSPDAPDAVKTRTNLVEVQSKLAYWGNRTLLATSGCVLKHTKKRTTCPTGTRSSSKVRVAGVFFAPTTPWPAGLRIYCSSPQQVR